MSLLLAVSLGLAQLSAPDLAAPSPSLKPRPVRPRVTRHVQPFVAFRPNQSTKTVQGWVVAYEDGSVIIEAPPRSPGARPLRTRVLIPHADLRSGPWIRILGSDPDASIARAPRHERVNLEVRQERHGYLVFNNFTVPR